MTKLNSLKNMAATYEYARKSLDQMKQELLPPGTRVIIEADEAYQDDPSPKPGKVLMRLATEEAFEVIIEYDNPEDPEFPQDIVHVSRISLEDPE